MAVVDLPEPDSPMMVTVSPASMQNDTPSTARMTPRAVISSICSSSTRNRLPIYLSFRRSVNSFSRPAFGPPVRSRRPSPSRLTPTTSRAMTRPGRVTSHQEVVT